MALMKRPTGCSARHARSSMAKHRATARRAGLIWLAWCRVIEGTTTVRRTHPQRTTDMTKDTEALREALT